MRTRKRKKTGQNDKDVSKAKKVDRRVKEGGPGNVTALSAKHGGKMKIRKSKFKIYQTFQQPPYNGPETVQVDVEKLREVLKDRITRKKQVPVTRDFHNLKEPPYECHSKLFRFRKFYKDLSKMISLKAFKYGNGTMSHGEEMDYDTLLRCIKQPETKRLMLIGQAGSGKSFMMWRLCHDITDRNKELLVLPISFTEFPADSNERTPCELLIGGLLRNSESCYEWIRTNQKKVVLVLDDLDRARWSLDDQARRIREYDKGKPSEIMSSIFRGDLLPNITVVCFSREHAVVPLAGGLRPKIVVAVNGFSFDDSKWLFENFGKPSACVMSWEILQRQFPSFIPLLSIPALLVMFSAYVYDKKYADQPKSMTSLIQNLLEFYLRSRHIIVKGDGIIGILKKLAFFSRSNKKSLLHINDLRNTFNEKTEKDKKACKVKMVGDFMIMVPILDMWNYFLQEGDSRFLFPHGIIQDFLSTQYILEMDRIVFEEAVSQLLMNEADQSSVTRFLSGLLLNDEVVNVHEVADVEQKRDTFKRMLMEKYRSSAFVSIELLGTIAESNHKDFIRDTVKSLRLENMTLDDSDVHTIASVVRHLHHLDELTLLNCNFTSKSLRILWDSMKHSKLKISMLDIQCSELNEVGYATLGEIVKGCDVDELQLQSCGLSTGKLKNLLLVSAEAKIFRLDVSGNQLDEDVAAILGDIVKQCSVEEITISGCLLNGGSLEILRASGAKISGLDGSPISEVASTTNVVKSWIDRCRSRFIDWQKSKEHFADQ